MSQEQSATAQAANDAPSDATGNSDTVVEDLLGDLDELAEESTSAAVHENIQETKAVLLQAHREGLIDSKRRVLDMRDAVEAFVGSVIFASPLLVEDGIFDIGDYLFTFSLGGFPVFLLANTLFVILMIGLLVYWAGPQDVQVYRPIFVFISRRLIGISIVSFLTAAALMTMWGRVDNWQDPVVAIARISVVWTVASFGAALGDILLGESSGTDINDGLSELSGQVGDFLD